MRSSPPCGSCRIAASRDASAREREPRDRRSLRPTAVHARSPRRSSIAVEVVIVTGGSSRIGRAAALSFGDHGGKVVIAGRRAYCVIPFLLPPKNPCPARATKASQAGRRRFDPGRPLSPRQVFRGVVYRCMSPCLRISARHLHRYRPIAGAREAVGERTRVVVEHGAE